VSYSIRYWADLNLTSGYHTAARGMLRALAACGFGPDRVRVVGTSVEDMAQAYADKDLAPYLDAARERPADIVNIVHANILDAGRFHTTLDRRYNILVTAWEVDALPTRTQAKTAYGERSAVEALKLFDQIWVPKRETVELMVDAGVEAEKVQLLPHPLLRVPAAPANKASNDRFRFYYIGSWDERKDVATLLQAYFLTGWSVLDPVELLIHTPPAPGVAGHRHTERVTEAFGLLQKQAGSDRLPNVGLLTTRRSRRWVEDFHAMGHCFVTASRGEGFCLPAAEAAAAGNLLVLPQHVESPFRDYPGWRTVASQAESVPPLSQYRGYELGHKWWRTDLESLRRAMIAAFEDRHLVETARAEQASFGQRLFDTEPTDILRGLLEKVEAAVQPRLDAWA
jgi:glycosyltransferase involved in cell wall biosynthesis